MVLDIDTHKAHDIKVYHKIFFILDVLDDQIRRYVNK